MKLNNNLSIATRAANQNLRNYKTAPKNPSFGYRIVLDRSFKKSLKSNSCSIGDKMKVYSQILKLNQENIDADQNEQYKGYTVKLGADKLTISVNNNNDRIYIKFNTDSVKNILANAFYIKNYLEEAFNDIYAVDNNKTSIMQKQLNKNLEEAIKSNVPEDVIAGYESELEGKINIKKAEEDATKYLANNKKEIAELYVK